MSVRVRLPCVSLHILHFEYYFCNVTVYIDGVQLLLSERDR
jgi:hypothetical protein